MDEHPEQLRKFLFEADLKIGGDIVHAGEWQVIRHGAVGRNIDPAPHPLDLKSCISRISGNSEATAFNRFSRRASWISSSPGSMVAGSLSM